MSLTYTSVVNLSSKKGPPERAFQLLHCFGIIRKPDLAQNAKAVEDSEADQKVSQQGCDWRNDGDREEHADDKSNVDHCGEGGCAVHI